MNRQIQFTFTISIVIAVIHGSSHPNQAEDDSVKIAIISLEHGATVCGEIEL